jgi:hypothetical protein
VESGNGVERWRLVLFQWEEELVLQLLAEVEGVVFRVVGRDKRV